MVENKRSNEMVCHMKDRPGFSHDHRRLCVWQRVINSQVARGKAYLLG